MVTFCSSRQIGTEFINITYIYIVLQRVKIGISFLYLSFPRYSVSSWKFIRNIGIYETI
jgi:hypothetical protein